MNKTTKGKQKTVTDMLEEASVPLEEQPYQVPENWEWLKLGNVSRFIDYRGKTPKKTESGIRLITAKNVRMGFVKEEPKEYISETDFDQWMTRGIPNKGDILFTTEAPLGNVAHLDTSERIALAQRIITISPFEPIEKPFLKYCLMSPQFQTSIKNNATGTTVSGIKASRLKEIAIPLAPLNEQKRIAEKIEYLFEKLDKANSFIREVQESLNIRKMAILDKAIKGELTLDFRKELSNDTGFSIDKDEGLKLEKTEDYPFHIPNNWKWVKFEDILREKKHLSYGILKAGEYDPNGIPMIRVLDIGNGIFNDTDLFKVRKELHEEYQRTKTEEGDILLAVMATIGRAVVVDKQHTNCNVNRALAVIKLKSDIDPHYICSIILSPYFQKVFIDNKLGSAQARINLKSLREFLIPLPTYEEQIEISKRVKQMLSLEANLEETISNIQINDLKQSILDKAFRGELGTNNPLEENARDFLKDILQSK